MITLANSISTMENFQHIGLHKEMLRGRCGSTTADSPLEQVVLATTI